MLANYVLHVATNCQALHGAAVAAVTASVARPEQDCHQSKGPFVAMYWYAAATYVSTILQCCTVQIAADWVSSRRWLPSESPVRSK